MSTLPLFRGGESDGGDDNQLQSEIGEIILRRKIRKN